MGFEDLDTYNRDTIHDMYVDSDYEINTGELPVIGLPLAQQELFDEADLDDYIDNLAIGIDYDQNNAIHRC